MEHRYLVGDATMPRKHSRTPQSATWKIPETASDVSDVIESAVVPAAVRRENMYVARSGLVPGLNGLSSSRVVPIPRFFTTRRWQAEALSRLEDRPRRLVKFERSRGTRSTRSVRSRIECFNSQLRHWSNGCLVTRIAALRVNFCKNV